MQMIRAIIDCKLIGLSIQFETTAGDPVRETAYGASEIGMISQIAIQLAESEHDVAQVPVSIGYVQFRDDRAEVSDLRDQTLTVGQGEKIHRSSIR
ncbi:hypothetical protein SDC9_206150 [bioreactor metagenome]|uniref:Uncharacterized protein n=1 Tax=bioreactor metagenome TaxID=1076179 RepID=A0A645J406_9ZZZZ